jgi:hypothetical protein
MKKLTAIILIISISLFIFGCEQGTESTTQERAFIGGEKGLEISFFEGAPPEIVYDKDYPFSIDIKIQNVGEWDVKKQDAIFTIKGLNPEDFGKTLSELTKQSPEDLNGAYRDPEGRAIEGTLTSLEFENLQYQGEVAGTVTFIVRADACYEYGTKAASKICVLEDLLGVTRRTGEKPVCEPNEAKAVENSGAPVHVTNLKETVVAVDKISFTFDVEHVGQGVIHQKNTDCSTEYLQQNKVYVKVDTGISGLTCSGLEGGTNEGFTSLFQGKRTILCQQSLPTSRGDFEKPINIELTYGYSEYIDKELKVRHIGTSS